MRLSGDVVVEETAAGTVKELSRDEACPWETNLGGRKRAGRATASEARTMTRDHHDLEMASSVVVDPQAGEYHPNRPTRHLRARAEVLRA